MKRVLCGCVIAAVALLLPGCDLNSCPYGSKANNGGCKGRGPATQHESTGWHTPSLAARLPKARREAGPRVVQVTINQYGELWAYTGRNDHVLIDVDGNSIEPKEDESATGDDPFPLDVVRPNVVDREMEYIAPRAPGFKFISAELYRGRFGHEKGLRWHIVVYRRRPSAQRQFLAAPDGRVLCEHVATAGESFYRTVSGKGCPDRGF